MEHGLTGQWLGQHFGVMGISSLAYGGGSMDIHICQHLLNYTLKMYAFYCMKFRP